MSSPCEGGGGCCGCCCGCCGFGCCCCGCCGFGCCCCCCCCSCLSLSCNLLCCSSCEILLEMILIPEGLPVGVLGCCCCCCWCWAGCVTLGGGPAALTPGLLPVPPVTTFCRASKNLSGVCSLISSFSRAAPGSTPWSSRSGFFPLSLSRGSVEEARSQSSPFILLKSGHGEIQILTYISIRALYVMVIWY